MDDEDKLQSEIDNLFEPRRHRDYRGLTNENKQLNDRVRHICQYWLWPEYRERVKERAREAKRRKGGTTWKNND